MILADIISKQQSIQPPKIDDLKREDLKQYFEDAWTLYEMLFSSLKADETFYLNPDPLRNPLIFYLGHTAALYINKLKLAGVLENGVHEEWDQLFAIGVDPNLPDNLDLAAIWPTVEEVRAYRKKIYNIVHQVIDDIDLSNQPITDNDPVWALLMGVEHDLIHFETSSVLIRQLEVDLVERPSGWDYAPTLGNPPKNEWIEVSEGKVSFGKPSDSNIYGWDNEYGSLTREISSFKATKNLITNAEFWDFVTAGAYDKKALWTEEGWEWKTRTNTSLPKFWIASQDTFIYRAMFDEMPMPMDWPVEVNAHEAAAYINWLNDGSRLLSEAEFVFLAREGTTESEDPVFSTDYNLHLAYGSPTPVGYMKNGTTPLGFNDLYGNVWDWLKDDHYELPGFKTHYLYENFSAPYMDEDHGMMAGGSWVTMGTGASKYYRLWFRRHFYQHAGFRLAKDC